MTQSLFILGSENSDHVRVEVTGRTHAGTEDFWDGNWVNSRISIRAGGFRGLFVASLRTTDFAAFHRDLAAIHRTLSGEATFETMEEWLSLQLVGDGCGHFEVRGTARDEAGAGNELDFSLPSVDQTHLPSVMAALGSIQSAFPTIGDPAA